MINAYLAIGAVLLGGMLVGLIIGLLKRKAMRTSNWGNDGGGGGGGG